MTVHLFAGEHDLCRHGMNGYVDQFADVEDAMQVANRERYDWAQIVQVSPLELKIVNVGRWDSRRKRMHWQAESHPANQYQLYLKSFHAVLKGGAVILAQLPVSKLRARLLATSMGMCEEIQARLNQADDAAACGMIHVLRQVVKQYCATVQRTSVRRAQDKQRAVWLTAAARLLKETEQIGFCQYPLEG